MLKSYFAFDLDGTITCKEILPAIGARTGLSKEIEALTELTLEGVIPFQQSFLMRVEMLKHVPVSDVQEVVSSIPLDPEIETFIKSNSSRCAVVTGNLDVWVKPIIEKLECRFFCSMGTVRQDRLVSVECVQDKARAIRNLRGDAANIVAIGESHNDIPMFEEADTSVAFGGVHDPIPDLVQIADYIVYEGRSLCRLLSTL